MAAVAVAEEVKRRLIVERKLPIVGRDADPEFGLAFDLLSSNAHPVITGQEDGVITLDLAVSEDVHREQLRIVMDEAYRTLLGHFRHEIAHSYFHRLGGHWSRCLARSVELLHWTATTATGGPEGWGESYVSSCATMHAAEDWPETVAHSLHTRPRARHSVSVRVGPRCWLFRSTRPGSKCIRHLIEIGLG